jgi:multisubunit Na+/H+ antiporter MnhC subunit
MPAGKRQPIRWVIGIYVVLQLASYAIGFDRLPAADEASSADRWLILTIAMAGVALAIADSPTSRRDLDVLLRALVAFTAVMALIGFLQYAGIVDLTQYIRIPGLSRNSELLRQSARGDGDFARVAGTANHFIEFGVVLALILPIALHYALFAGPRRRTKVLAWLQVGLVGGAIPLSISRSAILAAAVSLLLLAVIWKWRLRYNVGVIGLGAVIFFNALNPGLLGTIRGLFANVDDDPSVQNRLARTDTVIELWQTRPIWGRGAGMIIPERYLLLDNQIYVTLIASGIIGVVVLGALYLVPYYTARSIRLRTPLEEDRHLAQALAAPLPAALIAAATFDAFSFATYVGALFFIIGAIGALWRLTRGAVPPGTPEPLFWSPEDRYVAAPLMALHHPRWRSRILANSGPSNSAQAIANPH